MALRIRHANGMKVRKKRPRGQVSPLNPVYVSPWRARRVALRRLVTRVVRPINTSRELLRRAERRRRQQQQQRGEHAARCTGRTHHGAAVTCSGVAAAMASGSSLPCAAVSRLG
jgi:hypothetical protein